MKIKQHYPRNYKKFKEAVKKYRKQVASLPVAQTRLKNGDISIRIGRCWWMSIILSKFADGETPHGRLIFKNVPLRHPDWDRTMTFRQAWKLHQVLRRLDKL